MNQLLTNYGILVLVILFIIVSLYYKNFINILLFIVIVLVLRLKLNDNNAVMIAYGISLLYGIANNFHLLENFTNIKITTGNNTANKSDNNTSNTIKKNNLVPVRISDQKLVQVTSNNSKKNKTNKIKKLNKEEATHEPNSIVETSKDAPKIDEIISEELINKFIRRLKKEDNLLVSKNKINLYKLNPTLNKLSKNRIEKTKIKYLNDDNFVKKPIIITNDYFILDGHHKWFARKNLIENNTNGYNTTGIYSEEVATVIIDYDIKKCVQKLQEYKIKYNKEYLKKTINEINNIGKGKKYLEEIKEVIHNLENNYNKFASVELI
jgi:hypothetical protein